MARDFFWMATLFGVMAVVSVSALSHQSAWRSATFTDGVPQTGMVEVIEPGVSPLAPVEAEVQAEVVETKSVSSPMSLASSER